MATNALLERRGRSRKATVLYSAVVEARERPAADGSVITALDPVMR